MGKIADTVTRLARSYPGTRRELADAVGVDYPQLTRLISGDRPASLAMCEQLAEFFGYELRLAACNDEQPCEHLKELQKLKATQKKAVAQFVKNLHKKEK